MTRAARERLLVRIPVLAWSAAAWIGMALSPADSPAPCHGDPRSRAPASFFLHGLLHWTLMLAAMMMPLVTSAVQHVWERSFVYRRLRATAIFLFAYFVVWEMAGVVLMSVARAGRSANSVGLTIAAIVLVLLWQTSPFKQVCLNRLHAHPPLPAFGLVADRGVFRFGSEHAEWCVGSCWGPMLLSMILPVSHWGSMVVSSLWVWGEHFNPPSAPVWSLRMPTRAARLLMAQGQRRVSRVVQKAGGGSPLPGSGSFRRACRPRLDDNRDTPWDGGAGMALSREPTRGGEGGGSRC
jgi:predicted metal-binding membrane protein